MTENLSHNPLLAGMIEDQVAQPCSLVIFGGGGDLSHRKLLPALYNQVLDGALSANFAVLSVAREDMNDTSYREFARDGIERFSRQALDARQWPDFERMLHYQQGSFDDPQTYSKLKQRLQSIEPDFGIPGNRVFYLAIPPAFIETCVQNLKAAGLVNPVEADQPFSRIIVEKPIGMSMGDKYTQYIISFNIHFF